VVGEADRKHPKIFFSAAPAPRYGDAEVTSSENHEASDFMKSPAAVLWYQSIIRIIMV
jgi:hypothetical protein